MVKVSIIVPVYNVEGYIEKCMESLVNQTLKEIEILVVNDGTKDQSMEIVKKFKRDYPDKIICLEKENGGLSDARNYAIPLAKGEYIAFLDADDYVEKTMYQEMYEVAKKDNSDMVECDFYWEYITKRKEDKGEIYHEKQEMLEKIRVVAWNKLIKKEILEETKIQFPKGYRYEDVEFTYKLVPHLKKISFVKKPLIHYVQRENSISNSQNEKTKDIFDILEHVIKYYQENKFYDQYQEVLEYIYCRYLFCSSFLRMVKIKDEKIKENLLQQTWNLVNEKFPNWKKNMILRKNKTFKNIYMRTLNEYTFEVYSLIFSLI